MFDVITLGETMILMVPNQMGLLRYAPNFQRFVAGAESNLAIGLARLGHQVGWISRVGKDEFGQCILSFIQGEGVDISQVIIDPEAPTGVYFKERRRVDMTRVYYYRSGSAASRFSPSDVDPNYVGQARFLHLTGITPALSTSCKAAVERAIDVASEAQVPISFDPNIRLKLWSPAEARATLTRLISRVQLVLTSQEEARLLTDQDDPEKAARQLLQLGPSLVVVKLGVEGSLVITGDECVHEPAIKVEAVETVGAGDAFDAGFLAGQLRDWDLTASLRLGNVMGAWATTVPGDVEGLPTWDEIELFLEGDELVER